MKIRGLMVDPSTNMPVVILKDPKSEAVLPIWVGLYEANAIQLEVEKATTARPLTHDLLKNVVMGLNAQVQRVVLESHDRSPQAAAGRDPIAGLQRFQHRRPFLLAALLRQNQQEVKDSKDENERGDAQPAHTATARLNRYVECHIH